MNKSFIKLKRMRLLKSNGIFFYAKEVVPLRG